MRTVTLTAPTWVGRGHVLWSVVCLLAVVWVFNALGLYVVASGDMDRHGISLGEAVWQEGSRGFLFLLGGLGAVTVGCVVYLVHGIPRRRAVEDVRVGRDGVEFRTHAHWWYPGSRTLVLWGDVDVISAEFAVVAERRAGHTRHVRREVLDLYVTHDVGVLPSFADLTTLTDPPVDGVQSPARRVRVGATGDAMAGFVRKLTAVVGETRPGLFYRGVAGEQWYTPPNASLVAQPEGTGQEPPLEKVGDGDLAVPGEWRASGPVELWLDFRPWRLRTVMTVPALACVALVSYVPLHLTNTSDRSVLAGIVSLVFVLPFLCGVLGALLVLAALPRLLAPVGVRIGADGVDLVQKRPWRGRGMVRRHIPWGDVWAIVPRGAGAKGITDLYLRGDTTFTPAGVGLYTEVTWLPEPDSIAMASLVNFPALRLRFTHSRAAERRAVARWSAVDDADGEPRSLPGIHLQRALSAARPDLWHGFPTDAPVDT